MHPSSSQKMNIGVSRDMQSTNYTIKKQIQIQIHCELVRPTSCHTSHFKHRSVFWNSWVKRQTILHWFCSVRIKINRRSVIQFDKFPFGQYSNKSVSNNFGNFAISKASDLKSPSHSIHHSHPTPPSHPSHRSHPIS